MSDYEKQANDFLQKTGTKLTVLFDRHGKHFPDDKTPRDIYNVTLERGNRKYEFQFGQSLNNSVKFQEKTGMKRTYYSDGSSAENHKYRYLYPEQFPKGEKQARFSDWKIIKGTPPRAYDILACLTKYDPGTLENFCSEFEYDADSKKAERTYNAVKEEWQSVCMLFTDAEIEELQEIQ